MITFKVGDKIRRKKGTSYYGLEGIVTKINNNEVYIKETQKGESGYSCRYSFAPEYFELAKPRVNPTYRQILDKLND